jgi:hypothetical protein
MIDPKLLISVSIVLLLTFYDLNRSYINQTSSKKNSTSTSNDFSGNDYLNNNHDDISSIPPPKMKMHMAQTIKFRYCQSSGYVSIKTLFFIHIHHSSAIEICLINFLNLFAQIIQIWQSLVKTIQQHLSNP